MPKPGQLAALQMGCAVLLFPISAKLFHNDPTELFVEASLMRSPLGFWRIGWRGPFSERDCDAEICEPFYAINAVLVDAKAMDCKTQLMRT